MGGRLLERARDLLSRINWRATFRSAGPRVVVGLCLWCAGFAGFRYLLSATSPVLARSATAHVLPTATAVPAPLSTAPAVTLVSDAAVIPQPALSAGAAGNVVAAAAQSGAIYMAPAGTYANNYDWGQCTWYVASRRRVPSGWGNADTWYYRAKADGWSVGLNPVVGAIAQTSAGYYGHVALVEQVLNGGSTVVVSEMNYYGEDVHDTRTVPADSFRYIYQ